MIALKVLFYAKSIFESLDFYTTCSSYEWSVRSVDFACIKHQMIHTMPLFMWVHTWSKNQSLSNLLDNNRHSSLVVPDWCKHISVPSSPQESLALLNLISCIPPMQFYNTKWDINSTPWFEVGVLHVTEELILYSPCLWKPAWIYSLWCYWQMLVKGKLFLLQTQRTQSLWWSYFSFYFLFEPPAATLNVYPNRSQFFWYESVTLSCETGENSGNWTLKSNASQKPESCSLDWGISQDSNESSCTIENAYPSDSGLYWCESEKGECSNNLNITITGNIKRQENFCQLFPLRYVPVIHLKCHNLVWFADSDVILESPVFPVTEGDKITLGCYYKEQESSKVTSNFPANFYKDGTFIGSHPAGKLTLSAVSTSNNGFYKCQHPEKGESPQSWMTVRSKGTIFFFCEISF